MITRRNQNRQQQKPRIQHKIKLDLALVKPFIPPGTIRRSFIEFNPSPYFTTGTILNQLKVLGDKQREGLAYFKANPTKPIVYGVGSSPDDQIAKYFAAYLVEIHVRHMRSVHGFTNVIWNTVFGGFGNEMIDKPVNQPSLIVLSNVNSDSTTNKIEKVRDILEKYNNVPRIVVTSDEPYEFIKGKLKYNLNCLFYNTNQKICKKIEVI